MQLEASSYSNFTPAGLPQTVTRVDDQTVALGYDSGNRLASLTLPESGGYAHVWDYDGEGRLTSYKPAAPAGQQAAYETGYQYELGRLERIDLPDGYTVVPRYADETTAAQAEYHADCGPSPYLPVGAAYKVEAGNMELVSCFDDDGRVVSSTRRDGGSETTRIERSHEEERPLEDSWYFAGETQAQSVLSYAWDDYGRLKSLGVDGEPAVVYNYTLNGGLLSAGEASYAYDPTTRQLTSETIGGVVTTYAYFQEGHKDYGRVSSITTTVGGAPFWARAFAFDAWGRVSRLTETLPDASTRVTDYEYAVRGELWRVSVDGVLVHEYVPDVNGNRAEYRPAGGPLGVVSWEDHDPQDRLVTEKLDGSPVVTYAHTDRGTLDAMTVVSAGSGAVGSIDYEADAFDYVTSATVTPVGGGAASTVTYVTGPGGLLVEQTASSGASERFVYAGGLRPVAWYDGGAGGGGALKAQFVYGMMGHVPAYMRAGGVTYAVLSDHVGSVRYVVDASSGAVAQEVEYASPFGEVAGVGGSGGAGFQPFRFVGGLWDEETQTVRIGVRTYDPRLGRWLSKDSELFGRGGPNAYDYAFGDPVNWMDVDGRFAISGTVLGLTALAAIGGAVAACYASGACQRLGTELAQTVGEGLMRAADGLRRLNDEVYQSSPEMAEAGEMILEIVMRPLCMEEAPEGASLAGRHTDDQEALIETVNEATNGGRKPLSVEEAEAILDWADEVGLPTRAKPNDVTGNHPGSAWDGVPHIHVPGAGRGGHVPVLPGVKPRP